MLLTGSLVLALLAGLCGSAAALLSIDFEQKYFVHPKRQTWDFCLIRHESLYNIFYHTIHEDTPHSSRGDTIWRATSPDLRHWTIEGPVLTVGPDWWDSGAMWAPDVVWDQDRLMWAMVYTGVDDDMNQRACLAYSPDLQVWTKFAANPIFEPDPEVYKYDPEGSWSNFRDPFLFREDDVWNMLNTAKIRVTDTVNYGIVHRAKSTDLENWQDAGVFFTNDGDFPANVLESVQYHKRDGIYHLYFGEYSVYGISHLAAADTADWTMEERNIIDWGNAPEIKQFDQDIDIFARISAYQIPATGIISYCTRFDTLIYSGDGLLPDPYQPHPLHESFEHWEGAACLAQPTFGDNSLFDGEEPAGTVGNGYFGSAEYYQGPLSGRGQPGTDLGDQATGFADSYPFYVVGQFMELLVGGGFYPQTCYVALMDAEADTIIHKTTGMGVETMSRRVWDLRPYEGRLCYIKIYDQENGPMGHINVDEIHELMDTPSPVQDVVVAPRVIDHGPSPNPFNPTTHLRLTLPRDGDMLVRVHDLRGHVLWSSGQLVGREGANRIRWNGQDRGGRELPSGVYLYTVEFAGGLAASGKLVLMK
jgi:predicted GH43/DUF377 family glycosyl hydrolase